MIRTAYFAGGCFWCITPVYKLQKGVRGVRAGYCGGKEADPVYERVKAQKTGHRETIAVTYDDGEISYERLLEIFLLNVDPFDDGGQFIDRGFSYTLAIFYTDEAQRRLAEAALRALRERAGRAPAVALERFTAFCPAEEAHQDYYLKHPEAFEEEMRRSGRKQ